MNDYHYNDSDRDHVEFDEAAFELEREQASLDAEADRFEYLGQFDAARGLDNYTVEPRYVFVERPDGSFDVHTRARVVCRNQLLFTLEAA